MSPAQRGRGRPPTTGQYVGLAQAKAKLNAATAEQIRLTAEKELAEDLRLRREKNAASFRKDTGLDTSDSGRAVSEDPDPVRVALNSLETIEHVAKKSKNLKGTCVRAIKDAADKIKASVEHLKSRTMTEEVARLETANARLSRELKELRLELSELRSAQTRPTPALASVTAPSQEQVLEEVVRTVMIQVGGMVNARLEGLEDRLLPAKRIRPPLAADKRREVMMAATPPAAILEETTPVPVPSTSRAPEVTAKKGKKAPKAKKGVALAEPAKTNNRGPAAPAPLEEPWTQVVKRGKKRNPGQAQKRDKAPPRQPAKSAPQTRQPQSQKRKPKKLRQPRSAAVVISLLPGAEEKGITYAKVIAEAKGRINLGELGVPPIKMRTAATGARVLQIPGAENDGKADSLAAKLREVFKEAQEVKVTRPVVTTDLRVSGLDDSVTPEEMSEALARAGGCSPADFKVGPIRKGRAGMGTVFVRSPVAAAMRILASGGHLLVGWVSAEVKRLEARPRRCYRCLELGHVRAQCKSNVDRSDECHRCGVKGHKASDCTAAPHCTLCAAAGKPDGHLSGGKACAKPPSKRGARRERAKAKAKAKPQPTPSTVEMPEQMDQN